MGCCASGSEPSGGPKDWGSIKEVVNAPLINVAHDAWWISVFFMWVFLPLNLLAASFALYQCGFVMLSIGLSNCCIIFSGLGSVRHGRPLWLAPNMWRYVLGGVFAFIRNGMARLSLFIWEWKAFGSNDYWYHGEGVWCHSYDMVDGIMKSDQMRKSAFGCISAPMPDLFATNILIFLPNTGPESEWAQIRYALHQTFFSKSEARERELKDLVARDWPNATLKSAEDTAKIQRTVAKCIFYVMFGIWLDDTDAGTLAGWRTAAGLFIFPRLVQRFIFNIGINKVKKLREDTVYIIQKYQLEPKFYEMNASLPTRYQRSPVVKLCDEIMYVIGFAGIGGTSASVETTTSFLRRVKPSESASDMIDFGKYQTSAEMVAAYVKNPVRYIKEACRLDPPVTSATTTLNIGREIQLNGRGIAFPAGTLNQYVLSMANRDEKFFPSPSLFDPDRGNLEKALTWNGAFGITTVKEEEKNYPRICPGRYLALDICAVICNHLTQNAGP